MRRSLTRTFAAWLAILAMGLNGLWPLLANAAPAEFVAPICSMVGTTAAVDAGGMPMQPAPVKSPAPHCPFCSTGSDHNPALATAEFVAFAAPESMPQPLVSVFARQSSFVVLAAPPRGPPSLLI
ncbi:MAG: DUF2946 domain-containing protein [Betaproteobacteria bacterium]|jgi:hypothetical protein|nr:DUF2946 domain-containing protein [Betaproteobacteria bacterium]